MKKICFTLLVLFSMMAAKATVLYSDSGYPFSNGLIAGQDYWYVYSPSTPHGDAFVTNNVLLLVATNQDSVAVPTNAAGGWVNDTGYNYASFEIDVTELPDTTNGDYFCQLQDNNDTNSGCRVFIDTIGTTVPGTYRLGIANFSTSFSNLEPPNNYPVDLATNVTYTVVILFDTAGDDMAGANLWVNPSESDYENDVGGEGGYYTGIPGVGLGGSFGFGYAYGTDTTSEQEQLNFSPTQIGFSPYISAGNEGISNVIAATTFAEVNVTNPPVFGIQPQTQTNNYSGNSTVFYAVASGVDLSYQWYSTNYGALSDGPSYGGTTFVGSLSNTLVINNMSATDAYYCKVTDPYENSTNSLTATNDVDTTPTAPFFTIASVNATNNLFTQTGFTNSALGTGPLSYQWYFAPTNSGVYSAMNGQTGAGLNLYLADYTYQNGSFYVVASNSVNGGSIAFGPTNTLYILAPLNATMLQLHNLVISYTNQIKGGASTINVNTNNIVVSGYVSDFAGFGSSYTEFYMQDASGLGVQVYLASHGNTNTPPIGTYVTVSAPLGIYYGVLEMEPTAVASIATNVGPVIPIAPRLDNAIFNDLATNAFGTNGLYYQCSLVTFSNVYLYGSPSGGAFGSDGSESGVGGIFYSNAYTYLYFTVGGPYSAVTGNTNTMEIKQPTYNSGPASAPVGYNPFNDVKIPTRCYELTGIYIPYNATLGELIPSRLADYVTNAPPAPTNSIVMTQAGLTITTPQASLQTGSTYSVQATPSLTTPSWTRAAYGLGYWPTNVTFTDTNIVPPGKFYTISSP